MANLIARNASKKRIRDVAGKTLVAAKARGGDVQRLAETRVGALIETYDSLAQQSAQACRADDTTHATLMARDSESDLEIQAVCSEIWNALGRPAQSPDYDLIVGGSARAWTQGDPAKQPQLMTVLAANIRATQHPKLVERKEGWAKRIESCATAQAEAAKPTEAVHAQVVALGMQLRAVADSLQIALTRFKRDLKNEGMTEAQIHEIIPDASGAGEPAVAPPPVPSPAPQN